MNIARLRELCDAFDKGALRGEEMQELVALAREAASTLSKAHETVRMHEQHCARAFDIGSYVDEKW